jgi:PPE-repeat protein
MGDYEVPPEINSGRMYVGPGSGSLVASAASWQALAAQLGSSGAAFQAVVEALTVGSWLGPSSISMALAAAPYVVWMIATAMQCEQAAAAAAQAAMAFEAARAGVVPPPVIAENRANLATLVATNFMGVNTPAIAANEAAYDEMWAQDTTTMYGFASDASGITGSLVPFTAPLDASNPAGLAAQAASVGESAGTAAGQQPMNFASSTAMPAGMDAQNMLSMGPSLLSTLPSTLQGLASPLSSGLGGSGLGQFQSLISPFMSMFANPGMLGGTGAGAIGAGATPGLAGLSGVSAAAGEVEAMAGGAGSLGGLSVPATWTAGAVETTSSGRAVAPVAASGAMGSGTSAAPASAPGSGMYGGAPMAAGMGGRGGEGSGTPRYGTPVKVLRRS